MAALRLGEACDFSIKVSPTKLHWELLLHLPGCASLCPSASQALSPLKTAEMLTLHLWSFYTYCCRDKRETTKPHV